MKPRDLIKDLILVIVMSIVVIACGGPASARVKHRGVQTRHRSEPIESPRALDVFAPTSAQIIEQATTRQRNAPGVVRGIDAYAPTTATGGPPGGLPGNSGGP